MAEKKSGKLKKSEILLSSRGVTLAHTETQTGTVILDHKAIHQVSIL
jgi:hypothetical protein